MKKSLTPLQSALIAGVAILLVLGGGLLFLNRPDGQLTREEVIKLQRGSRPPENPAPSADGAPASPATGSAANPPTSGDGRSPGGVPGL